MITIKQIERNSPVLITVAGWLFEQWGQHRPNSSLAKSIEKLKDPAAVFVTLVAFDADGMPIGTASITKADMKSHPELSPWMAAVYVLKEFRGRGVAGKLCEQIKLEFTRLGYQRGYLYTDNESAVRIYGRIGWQLVARENYEGLNCQVMKLDL